VSYRHLEAVATLPRKRRGFTLLPPPSGGHRTLREVTSQVSLGALLGGTGACPVVLASAQPAAAAASAVSTAVCRSSVCWWPSRA
jgi:hypothetical protein